MTDMNYKAAYERQKLAREQAEKILEDKSRELFEANESLVIAYTKLRDQKAQMFHQEKLASIGQLAAGVAHEINNPIGFVKSNLNTLVSYVKTITSCIRAYEEIMLDYNIDLEKRLSQLEKIRRESDIEYVSQDINDLIEESLTGVKRVEEIVMGLKSFSRPDQQVCEEFSINECITNTLKLVNSEVKYKANIKTHFDDIPKLSGSPGAISQVILNLIVNASDAIEDAPGEIEIRTEEEKGMVKVSISDNGQGIPQNIINNIFDPFFTTKDIDKGTGLGLAISHNIVKKHGGRMLVDSEEGVGTRFLLTFPTTTSC